MKLFSPNKTILFLSLILLASTSFADGTWTHYTSTYNVNDIAVKGNDLWYATDGGVVHRNIATDTYRKYTDADGLEIDGEREIAIDSKGIVWSISRKSLYRYDGISWEKVPDGGRFNNGYLNTLKIDSKDRIWIYSDDFYIYDGENWEIIERPEIYIGDFTIDHDGGLWICSVGINYYNGTEWKSYTIDNGLPSNRPISAVTSPDGSVWFAFLEANGSIGHYKDGEWHFDTYIDGTLSYINSFIITSDNKIWVSKPDGISYYDGILWKNHKTVNMIHITIDDNETIWGISNFGEIASFDGVNIKSYKDPAGLESNVIRSLAIAPDGKLWVGTEMGYSTFDGTTFEPHTNLLNDLTQCSVYPIFIASDSKICMGAGAYIFIYDNSEWLKEYVLSSTTPSNAVTSIAESGDGTIWFGTLLGIYSYKNGILTYDDISKTFGYISSVVSDIKGNIWAGTLNGVYRYNGSLWTRIGAGDPVASKRITSIAVATNGDVWATGYGAACYSKGQWTSYTTDNVLPTSFISHAAADSTGTMWFGSSEGLISFDGTNFHLYTINDGLPGGVRKIAVSPSNEKWIVTYDSFYTFDDVSFKKVINSDFRYLYSGSVLFDKNGVVWVGTGFGLFKYTPEIIDAVENRFIAPAGFEIKGNYPNPFNPNTTISFSLAKESPVEIAVYNIEGQKIKTLFSGVMSAGNHSSLWDGRNETGQNVSSGIYFARLKSGNIIENHKMLLLR